MDAFLVVLAIHDTITAQLSAILLLLTLVHISPPLLNNSKHQASAIDCAIFSQITLSWVVEDTVNDAVDGTVCIDAWVIPASNELGNNPFEDLRGDLSSRLVKDLQCVSSNI
jgi:hypothetical protein